MNKLAIIVPAYNEEKVIVDTAKKLGDVVLRLIESGKIAKESFICFVDDGSLDNTWTLIEKLSAENAVFYRGIKFSRNFGHQNALLAGLFNNDADFYVTIDADLQDDENAIELMIDKYNEGAQIVSGVRNNREADTFFKRFSAENFYRIMEMLGVTLTFNHADFRLMSRCAVETLKTFQEKNLFLRALIPILGFKQEKVFYKRKSRELGESKYPIGKMISFAINGVTGFSVQPLRIAFFFGILTLFLSFLLFIYSLTLLCLEGEIPEFEAILTAIFFFGSVQLISIGILGEYLGKTYTEIKKRPTYIIEKQV